MASSSSRTLKYDVFPSFSGEDVRKSFLSHLLQALKRKSIISFIDNGIERSHLIADDLLLAIRQSRISIVVLSKKYASSTWCLNELGEINECLEESGQMVIPIFYDVDPSHVRKQTGEFGKAFETTCKGNTEDDRNRWKKALVKVACIAGYDSQNWSSEADAIEQIAKDVLNKLFTPFDDFRDFVGIDAHIETLSSMLCFEYGEVRMVGILGPSGIGKSTIARAFFSRFSSQFHHRAFVSYKRTIQDKKIADFGMKLSWAKHFLSEILCQKEIEIESLSMVEQRLKHMKVLIVLDDVDEIELLETLVGQTRWFGFGSRIIVVTQDRALLESHGIDLIYEMEFPSEDLSLQMFCQSAFGQTSPPVGFMELAAEVANLSGNLPLGLNVLGSSLRRKVKERWMEMMPRFRNGLNGKIEKTLRVCYDELDEKDDQDIFLHIACLFNGESVTSIKNLLEKSFYTSVNTRLRSLADKSLVRITTPHGTLQMHILLQKLGREIVRAESIYNPGKRRFLVDAKDISDVFNDNIRTENVLGICLHTPEINESLFIDEKSFEGMCNLQFIKFYKERWAQRTGEVRLYLPQGLIYLPRKLRLLHWDEYPAKYIPSSFSEYLVEFRMEDSKLEKLWEGAPPLRCLKAMNIAGSEDLKEIPDLSNATNLEILDFSGCTSLVTLPCSIRNLKKLLELWMFGCSNLEVLPTDINLESLDNLSLRRCPRLQTFPLLSKNISCLLLDGTAMEEEDCLWIENLSSLTVLDWENCPLRSMPSNFHPEHLTELTMRESNLEKLWAGVQSLSNLTSMALSGCKNLKEIPDLSNATNLEELDLSGCKSLKEIPDLSKAINLELLNLSGCSRLTSFPQLPTSIKLLHLDDTAIEEVPSCIENIAGLTNLWMQGCHKLRKIPATIWNLKHLQCVDFTECGGITSVSDANLVKTVAGLHAESNAHHHMGSSTEFLFRNCFSLVRDAQKFILQSDFKYAVLPGKLVPTYFTHRTCGPFLTVPLPRSSRSPNNLGFTACIVPEPMTASLSPKIITVQWKFRGVTGMCNIDPVSDFCEMDHMVVFRFGFCPQEEVNDPPSPLDYDNIEFEFELHSTYLCQCYDILGTKDPDLQTCPSLPCKIKGCGVRVLNIPPSLDANVEIEYSGQSGESDVETERSKKRMRMTVVTSQEHCNPSGGQTLTPNLDLSSVLDGASSSFHVDGASLYHSLSPSYRCTKEETLCVDPMITEQEDTETPTVDTSFSSQLLNFFRFWK